ncbi:hypothetical protein [Halosimplex sp. TS25]|uniref:hypothetical protein n=1 Tax=Halosimplex rarum TaxID=3396619 RepID=UPI0039EB0C5B
MHTRSTAERSVFAIAQRRERLRARAITGVAVRLDRALDAVGSPVEWTECRSQPFGDIGWRPPGFVGEDDGASGHLERPMELAVVESVEALLVASRRFVRTVCFDRSGKQCFPEFPTERSRAVFECESVLFDVGCDIPEGPTERLIDDRDVGVAHCLDEWVGEEQELLVSRRTSTSEIKDGFVGDQMLSSALYWICWESAWVIQRFQIRDS